MRDIPHPKQNSFEKREQWLQWIKDNALAPLFKRAASEHGKPRHSRSGRRASSRGSPPRQVEHDWPVDNLRGNDT
jgi:hypothetical protein